MLLVIDAGNTNIVFALYDKSDAFVKSWRIHTDPKRSKDEYAALLHRLFQMENVDWPDISSVFVSSVVPEVNRHLQRFCLEYIQTEARFVTRDMIALPIRLDKPEEAGADRLVNAVAVMEYYQAPAVVIDFGTATTFDVVGRDGAYEGGIIAPGINLSIDALNRAAAKLPSVSVRNTEKVIGKNTVDAIQSGVFWGYVGLIEGLVQRIADEMGEKPLVLATGGLAVLFADYTDVIDLVDEDLTLKGLFTLYKSV